MKSKFHPWIKGIDLFYFLKRQEHPSFTRGKLSGSGGARPEALAGHRSQGSLFGQEGDPRRNTARFSNILLCPTRPWPALGAAQPSSLPSLPSHTRFGMGTPALVQTPSSDLRLLSKPTQIPPMWEFSAPVSSRRVNSNDFSELVTVPPERLSRRRTTLPAHIQGVHGGIKEKHFSAAHTKHRPSLGALGKSPTLDVRLLCLYFLPKGNIWEEGCCSRALFPKEGKTALPFPGGASGDPCERCLPRGGRAVPKPALGADERVLITLSKMKNSN